MSKKRAKVKYSRFRDQLKTFDVLCCIPPGIFMGWIEHTAMVYCCKETGQIMVYRSTTQTYAGKNGVTLTPIAEFVRNYTRAGGRIYHRSCYISRPVNRGRAQQLCSNHIKQYRGKPYPNLKTRAGRWYVANARIDLPIFRNNPWTNADIDTIFFCAHLIGHNYRASELTFININPAEVHTKDFREDQWFEKHALRPGVKLGDEIEIIRG